MTRPQRRDEARELGLELRLRTGEVVHLVGIGAHVVQLAVAVDVLDVQVLLRANARRSRGCGRVARRPCGRSRGRASSSRSGAGADRTGPRPAARRRRAGAAGPWASRSSARRAAPSARSTGVGDCPRARSRSDRPSHCGSRSASAMAANVGARSVFAVIVERVRLGRDPRAPHRERHVDVGVVRRLLARRQAVLAEVEPVVGREHDVGVVQRVQRPERRDEVGDTTVDRLQRLEPPLVEAVDRRCLVRRELRQVADVHRHGAHVGLVVARSARARSRRRSDRRRPARALRARAARTRRGTRRTAVRRAPSAARSASPCACTRRCRSRAASCRTRERPRRG